MPASSTNPFIRLGLFLAVLLSGLSGGNYLLTLRSAEVPRPVLQVQTNPAHPTPKTLPAMDLNDDDEIFKIAEQMPLFPGANCGEIKKYAKRKACSDEALLSYVYGHIVYPKRAREHEVEGMAVVSFVVEKNGVITNIKVVRDPGMGTGEAAAKVIRYMKADNIRFEPALQRGKPVRVQFNLPVKFKLE